MKEGDKSLGEKILISAGIYAVTHIVFGPVGAVVASILLGGDDNDCSS